MPCLLGDIILKPQHCFIKAHRVSSYTTSTQPGSSSTEFKIMYTKSCHPLSQLNLHAFQITPYLAWFSIIKHNNRYFKLDTNKKSSSSTLPEIGSKMRKIFFFFCAWGYILRAQTFKYEFLSVCFELNFEQCAHMMLEIYSIIEIELAVLNIY